MDMLDLDKLWNDRVCAESILKGEPTVQPPYHMWSNQIEAGPSGMLQDPRFHQKVDPTSFIPILKDYKLPENNNLFGGSFAFRPDNLGPSSLMRDITPPRLSSKQNNQNAVVMSREEALVTLSEKTSYPILQENGQRRYGPPPNWIGSQPLRGCEVFIGKIPRDCFEDELVPIFEMVGRIYMFRLMMDFSGCNRGYGFCIYTNREDTRRAVSELDSYEIRRGKMLGVCFSVDNCRLFVGGIPKSKTKDEIMGEMLKVTEGVKDVIVYPSVADKSKNRGFAFVEYENHKAAAMARRKLIPGRIHLWGHQIAVDWAEPEREVDEDIMSKVRILYVRNLMLHTTEETLRDHFNRSVGICNAVERVKKIRDYAFVHFADRLQASVALRQLDGTTIDGAQIEVTWAKPVDKNEAARLNRITNSNLFGALNTSTLGYPQSSEMMPVQNKCDLSDSLNMNMFRLAISPDEPLHVPLVGYFGESPQLKAIKVGSTCSAYQNSMKLNELPCSTVAPYMNGGIQPVDLNSMTMLSHTTGQLTPRMLTGTQVYAPSLVPEKESTRFITPRMVLAGATTDVHTRTPPNNELIPAFVSSLAALTERPESRLQPTGNQNMVVLPKVGSMLCQTSKSHSNLSPIKALTDICLKHGLGVPKLTTQTHHLYDNNSGSKTTMFTVQVFIPGLQRHFFSPNPLPTLDEATKTITLATLHWFASQQCMVRLPDMLTGRNQIGIDRANEFNNCNVEVSLPNGQLQSSQHLMSHAMNMFNSPNIPDSINTQKSVTHDTNGKLMHRLTNFLTNESSAKSSPFDSSSPITSIELQLRNQKANLSSQQWTNSMGIHTKISGATLSPLKLTDSDSKYQQQQKQQSGMTFNGADPHYWMCKTEETVQLKSDTPPDFSALTNNPKIDGLNHIQMTRPPFVDITVEQMDKPYRGDLRSSIDLIEATPNNNTSSTPSGFIANYFTKNFDDITIPPEGYNSFNNVSRPITDYIGQSSPSWKQHAEQAHDHLLDHSVQYQDQHSPRKITLTKQFGDPPVASENTAIVDCWNQHCHSENMSNRSLAQEWRANQMGDGATHLCGMEMAELITRNDGDHVMQPHKQ